MIPDFFGKVRTHKQLLGLAVPMIVANITTPLVGLVDTAVLGHMHVPDLLAGASVAALMLTQLVWVCGFLRMSTTGLSAQAFGLGQLNSQARVAWQSAAIALVLGCFVLCVHPFWFAAGVQVSAISGDTLTAASDYFGVRVWSMPFVFVSLALSGWLIGRQLTRSVLLIQIAGNLLNVLLNMVFVYGFDWGVAGVAAATVCAEVTICMTSLGVVARHISTEGPQRQWFSLQSLRPVASLNTAMLVRNLVLQVCLAFLTFQGARYGVMAAAVNALIMQFFALIALGLDGVAYGVEALVGKAKGENRMDRLKEYVVTGLVWSSALALIYCLVFAIGSRPIAELLTSHDSVVDALGNYTAILVLLPLLGHWCFLLDGVAIGLTKAALMRDTMFVSALVGFFGLWWLCKDLHNQSLWIAMLGFLSCRGLLIGIGLMKVLRCQNSSSSV